MSSTTAPTLARDSGRTLIGSVVSNACNVLVILVIARTLGGAVVGLYTVAFAVRAILQLVCGLGMRAAMTRFVAAHLARGDVGGVRGSVALGQAVPFGLSVVVGAVWFALAEPLATGAFHDAALVVPLRLVALSLPFVVLVDTALAATQGFSTMRAYTWVGQVLEPGLRLVLTVVLLALGGGLVAATASLLVAGVVTGLVALASLGVMVRGLPRAPATYPARELVAFGAASWVASMATQGLLWADVVILGVLVSAEEVGSYQVAARVVLVGSIVVTSLNAAVAARFASAWERGDVAAVAEKYRGTVLWIARLTWPVLAGLVAVPAAVLHLFGSDFTAATTVVVVLAVGAAADVLGATAAVLLNQIGRNRLNMAVNLTALTVNIALNLALVPWLGIDGAAVAWAVTLVGGAAARIVAVRRVGTGTWPWGPRLVVAGIAAVLSGACAAGIVRLLPDVGALRLAVAAVVVVAGCLGIVVLRGLDRVERDALVRGVSLRLPALRRAVERRRLRHARPGTEQVAVEELLSPFRADVLARQWLFTTARDQQDLLRRDRAALVALARAGLYGAWFDEVVVPRGTLPSKEPADLDRTFAAIVSAALGILERHEHGASSDPLTITRVAAGTDVGGWRIATDRWVLLDGGHRLALALLDGRTHLDPHEYLVVDDEVPPNNTRVLLESGRLASSDVPGWSDLLIDGTTGEVADAPCGIAAT